MHPFEQRKINFPLKIFQKFFYEKIPEWCPESTAITTSLHAFLFLVLRGDKFSNTQKCSTPLIFLKFIFLQKYFNHRPRARKYRAHCILCQFYANHEFWELTCPKLTQNQEGTSRYKSRRGAIPSRCNPVEVQLYFAGKCTSLGHPGPIRVAPISVLHSPSARTQVLKLTKFLEDDSI